MDTKPTMIELDADHRVWNNELNDIKEELLLFEKELEKLDISQNVQKEHFQNLFHIHNLALNDIKNKIQKCQLHNQKGKYNYYAKVNEEESVYHNTISTEVDKQIELYSNLKDEFQSFLMQQSQ